MNNLDLFELLYDCDSVFDGNIYRVTVISSSASSDLRVRPMVLALKGICKTYMISSDNNLQSTFIIASHLSPMQFEKLLSKRFGRYKILDSVVSLIF